MASHQKEGEKLREVLGVIPAAGWATRLMPLPFSKELYPIGLYKDKESGRSRLKVVCDDLLEKFHLAGIKKAYVILREGKWDIPAYFKNGGRVGLHLAYLLVDTSAGVPFTLDYAYPFMKNSMVAFGFPDIAFQPHDAFVNLLDRQSKTKSDIVLGLFRASNPEKVDMVEVDSDGRVRAIVIKQNEPDLTHAWIIAVWTPTFTKYLHDYVVKDKELVHKMPKSPHENQMREIFIGDVIQTGINEGLIVDSVIFKSGTFLDIGTSYDLVKSFPPS